MNKDEPQVPPLGRGHMAVPRDTPPGQEQDGKGNIIPFEKRTRDDQERARRGQKD